VTDGSSRADRAERSDSVSREARGWTGVRTSESASAPPGASPSINVVCRFDSAGIADLLWLSVGCSDDEPQEPQQQTIAEQQSHATQQQTEPSASTQPASMQEQRSQSQAQTQAQPQAVSAVPLNVVVSTQ